MTTIFCSAKLAKFLGRVDALSSVETDSHFGNWNGHSFHILGKRCLLLVNDKTCYSVVIPGVLKKELGDFRDYFRTTLIRQLVDDFRPTERVEALLWKQLSEIRLCHTNNNRNVNGTMNQHVFALRTYMHRFGSLEMRAAHDISYILNETPVSAKVWANRSKSNYFFPREAMAELLETVINR